MRDELSEIEHVQIFGNSHDEIHVVFDEQEGHSARLANACEGGDQRLLLGHAHARNRLVQQHESRIRHERAAEFDQFLQPVRQIASDAFEVGLKPQKGSDVTDFVVDGLLLAPRSRQRQAGSDEAGAGRRCCADEEVVAHRHRREQAYILESPGDAERGNAVHRHGGNVVRVELHATVRRLVDTGKDIDEGGLSRTVRTYQPDHLLRA